MEAGASDQTGVLACMDTPENIVRLITELVLVTGNITAWCESRTQNSIICYIVVIFQVDINVEL